MSFSYAYISIADFDKEALEYHFSPTKGLGMTFLYFGCKLDNL